MYLAALGEKYRRNLAEIEIVKGAGTPMTIKKRAKERLPRRGRRQSSFEENDKIWAMFDRDEHPDVNRAIQECTDAGIGVAFSDPCFEVWLVLHYEEFDQCVDRHAVIKECEKVCPSYERKDGKRLNAHDVIKHLEFAENRAETQHIRRKAQGSPLTAPFTTVYEFTRAFRKSPKV